jgi:hypothetical protein
VCAARRYGIVKIDAIMVEAEPRHCRWALLNMADNGIPPEQFELIEAGTAAREGEAPFCITWPQGRSARDFYSQTLMPEMATPRPTTKTYAGHSVLDFYDGWEGSRSRRSRLLRSSATVPSSISLTWTSRAQKAKSSRAPLMS